MRIFAYVAMVVTTAGGLYFLQAQTADRLKENQIQACERGNELRRTLNVNAEVLKDFLRTAHHVRQAAADLAQKQGNKKESRINQVAADGYKKQYARLVPVAEIKCKLVIR